ncbi:MAG: cytochrome P450 [Actinobacteria bacterium]|nr:cytochrome P450 [Actinomycetota bacterium]
MKLSDVNLNDPDVFREERHHEMFRLLRAEEPVYFHPEPEGPGFWCITKHADLITINRDNQMFSSAAAGINIPDSPMDTVGDMMLYMDPPRHTRYRLLVNKGFTPRMINALETSLKLRSQAIVNSVCEKGECDFVEDLAAELPLQAIAELLGVPQDDRKKLFEWSNKMIGVDDPEYEGNRDEGQEIAAELYLYFNSLAEAKRSDPDDGIVSKLLTAEVEGHTLNEVEFDMFALLLTVAGNETTRNATSHGMRALIENPSELEKLRDDPSAERFESAVEEILRWATPVLYFRRTATDDFELRGKHIKKGDKVVMWHISANRDEEVFEDPFSFDIDRSPNDHIAFGGGGPHFCLGANLARMELRIIFDEIVRRLPDIDFAGDVELLRSNFIGGIKHMPVKFFQIPARSHLKDLQAWLPGPFLFCQHQPHCLSLLRVAVTPRRRLLRRSLCRHSSHPQSKVENLRGSLGDSLSIQPARWSAALTSSVNASATPSASSHGASTTSRQTMKPKSILPR